MKDNQRVEDVYRITGKLREGGNATVYTALNQMTNEHVAIKWISKRNGSIEANLRQIEILMMVDHDNIIQLKDYIDTPNDLMLIMELALGGDVVDRIEHMGFLSERLAVRYCRQMLMALCHCHLRGIVHCDLKPENILFSSPTEDAVIKIADFGFAQLLSSNEKLVAERGTPEYIAPEVLTGAGYGTAADMWSFGVVVYILLSGVFPFYSDDMMDLSQKIRGGHYKFFEKHFRDVSDMAKDFISKLLVIEPERRMTAHQCLLHPWITNASPSSLDLSNSRESLSDLNKSRHLQQQQQQQQNEQQQGALSPDSSASSVSATTPSHSSLKNEHVSHCLSSIIIHSDRDKPNRRMPLGATVGGGGDKGEGAGDGGAAPSTIISSNGLNNHSNNNSDKSSSSSGSGSARGGGGASTVHGGADEMGDGGLGRGMQAVISLAYEEDERKNISAAEAISNYCINELYREQLVRCGVLRALVHLTHKQNVILQNHAMLALYHIVQTVSLRDTVANSPNVVCSIFDLASQRSNVVGRQAARVIGVLLRSESQRLYLVSNGAISALVRLLSSPLADHQIDCLKALEVLAENPDWHIHFISAIPSLVKGDTPTASTGTLLSQIMPLVASSKSVGVHFLISIILFLLSQNGEDRVKAAMVSTCVMPLAMLAEHEVKLVKMHALKAINNLATFDSRVLEEKPSLVSLLQAMQDLTSDRPSSSGSSYSSLSDNSYNNNNNNNNINSGGANNAVSSSSSLSGDEGSSARQSMPNDETMACVSPMVDTISLNSSSNAIPNNNNNNDNNTITSSDSEANAVDDSVYSNNNDSEGGERKKRRKGVRAKDTPVENGGADTIHDSNSS